MPLFESGGNGVIFELHMQCNTLHKLIQKYLHNQRYSNAQGSWIIALILLLSKLQTIIKPLQETED